MPMLENVFSEKELITEYFGVTEHNFIDRVYIKELSEF